MGAGRAQLFRSYGRIPTWPVGLEMLAYRTWRKPHHFIWEQRRNVFQEIADRLKKYDWCGRNVAANRAFLVPKASRKIRTELSYEGVGFVHLELC